MYLAVLDTFADETNPLPGAYGSLVEMSLGQFSYRARVGTVLPARVLGRALGDLTFAIVEQRCSVNTSELKKR